MIVLFLKDNEKEKRGLNAKNFWSSGEARSLLLGTAPAGHLNRQIKGAGAILFTKSKNN